MPEITNNNFLQDETEPESLKTINDITFSEKKTTLGEPLPRVSSVEDITAGRCHIPMQPMLNGCPKHCWE